MEHIFTALLVWSVVAGAALLQEENGIGADSWAAGTDGAMALRDQIVQEVISAVKLESARTNVHLVKKIQLLETSIEGLHTELKELKQNADVKVEPECICDVIWASIEDLQIDVGVAKDLVIALTKEYHVLVDNVTSLQQEDVLVSAEIQGLENSIAQDEIRIDSNEADISVLRTDVTQLQVEDGVLHAVDNILSQEDVLLQHEDQRIEESLENNIEQVQNTLDGDIEILENTIAKVEGEIDHLQGEINQDATRIDNLEMRGRKSSICGWREIWERSAGTITYDTVHTEVEEVSSVLDANTGIYTAGVNGVYEISLSGLTYADPGGLAAVWLEGAGYGSEDDYFIYSENSAINGGVIVDTAAATRHVTLTAGQQISLKYKGNADFWRIKFCVTLY